MKLSELQIGTEYAVVPSWTYSSRSARDVDSVRENDVVKAVLVEKTKYEYEPSYRKQNVGDFTKAKEGNRSIGVIVKATDNNGADYYWTSRLADIIAPYSQLEPRWQQQQSEQQKREEEERQRRLVGEEIRKREQNKVATARNSIIATSKELLGESCQVDVSTEGYNENTKAIVTVSLNEYERLLELAYEGKASA